MAHAAHAAVPYVLCETQTAAEDVEDVTTGIGGFESITARLQVKLDVNDVSVVCQVQSATLISITSGTHSYDLFATAQYMDSAGSQVNLDSGTRLQGSGGNGTNVWDWGSWDNVYPIPGGEACPSSITYHGFYDLSQNKQENSNLYYAPDNVPNGPGYCGH